MNYQEMFDPEGKTVVSIYEPTIGFIPLDEANRDYQGYLEWLSNNNVSE